MIKNKICFTSRFKEAMKYNVTGVKTDYSDLLFYDEDGNNVTTEGLSEFEILGAAFEDVVRICLLHLKFLISF